MGLPKLLWGILTRQSKIVRTGLGADVLGHSARLINGEAVPLDGYRGNVLLIVNVASKCGMTPQYEQLEALHKKYHGDGLRILGFPSNDFGSQEPGANEEIQRFCSVNYGVDFDMFEKIRVTGSEAHPLYADLISKERNGDLGGAIAWNFTKFLIDRRGHVVARAEPPLRPDAPEFVACLEARLAEGTG